MGFFDTVQQLYQGVDARLGGMLPGGVAMGTPFGSSLGEAVAMGNVPGTPMMMAPGGMPRMEPGAMPLGLPAPGGLGLPMQMPAMPMSRPSGKTFTVEVVQYPNGMVVPKRVRPGRVALFAADLQAVKRVKKVKGQIRRYLPDGKRSRKAYKAAGKVYA